MFLRQIKLDSLLSDTGIRGRYGDTGSIRYGYGVDTDTGSIRIRGRYGYGVDTDTGSTLDT